MKKNEFWFIYQNDYLLILQDNSLLTPDNIKPIESNFLRKFKIAQLEHASIFCAELSPDSPLPQDVKLVFLKQALEQIGESWYAAAVKAYGILNWDRTHQYCGKCGNKTAWDSNVFERKCKTCNQVFYPRISPSIIVLVQKEDEILMARSAHFPEGVYGLIAGFVEPGESMEEAVHREVMEEVEIKIKNLRYFGSQAWPFPDSLMVGFFADYASGDLHPDGGEIEKAGWYKIDKLPGRPSTSVSIASRMIDAVSR